jgi:hypothetical protein
MQFIEIEMIRDCMKLKFSRYYLGTVLPTGMWCYAALHYFVDVSEDYISSTLGVEE